MARRHKPHDPAKATRERLEEAAERKRMEGQGATVTTDRAGKIVSARRSNVFNLLLQRGTITPNHHDAAYTLANEWAAWKGLDGKPEGAREHIDGGSGCAELVTDRMIRAGKAVERTLSALHPISRIILERFMVATVEEDRAMVWRAIMSKIGFTSEDKQTQAFVGALEDLRIVYQEPGRQAA
jgi:hypothetical protein